MNDVRRLLRAFPAACTLALAACVPPGTVADLVVTATTVPSTTVHATDAWDLGASVKNSGTATAAASTLQYWLSTDGSLDAGDTLVRSSAVPALAAGSIFADVAETHSASGWGVSEGTRSIIVVADGLNAVTESTRSNNTLAATLAVYYESIIIDTYKATAGGFGTTDTFLSLFGPGGDPTLDASPTLWNDDTDPFTVDSPPTAIAEDNDGNATFATFARITYASGIAPGTYYVRIRGKTSTENGPYAVRVLTAIPADPYAGWQFDLEGVNSSDAPYETDDNPASGGIPTNAVPIALGGKLNRYLALPGGDVDWLVLTLP